MDIFEVMKKRRSIRCYLDKLVEDNKLNKILDVARLSPSAVNRQPWHVIIIKDPFIRKSLQKAYDKSWFFNAPVIVAVCADVTQAWNKRDGEEIWKIDAAIFMQNFILAATSEGLGTCWIAAFDEKITKELLEIPPNIRVVALTPLGYPKEQKGPVVERKDLDEIVHYDKW